MSEKIRIGGVQINLEEASKAKDLKSLEIFDNDASYDALAKEIEAYKGKEKPAPKVEVVKGKKAQ